MGTNLGSIDRVIRGVFGALLIAVGLLFLRGAIGVVLCLLGALLIFSSVRGFCHVCKVLHIDTSKKA